MDHKGIGILNLPNQRYRSFCQRGIQYNIMLVGGRGSGKSSFMNMILNNDILHLEPFSEEALKSANVSFRSVEPPYNSISGANMHPSEFTQALVNFQVTKAHFQDKRFNVRVTITEVDGVGDQINNEGCWEPILSYISDMNKHYFSQEYSTVRSKIEDRRIHVCLFFIESTSVPFKTLENHVMRELSKVCNLIPVVSKSDFLTDVEAAEFYEKIKNHLEKENITFCDPRNLSLWKKVNGDAPFFVVAGSRNSPGLKERFLPFAKIDIEGEEFKDLKMLKRILIDDHMLDLIHTTDYFYEMYRADQLSSEIKTKDGYSDSERELIASFMVDMKEKEKVLQQKKLELLTKKKMLEADIRALEGEMLPAIGTSNTAEIK